MIYALPLAAGSAGAFAIGRQEIADFLAGVAIAISLVPPLYVVGITLYRGGFVEVGGVFLLFLTNFIAILVAGTAMFGLMGLPKAVRMEMKEKMRKKAMVALIIASILLVSVLAVTSYQTYQATNDQIVAKEVVKEWIGFAPYQIQKVVLSGEGVDAVLSGESTLPPLETLSTMMQQKFDHTEIIRLHTIPEKWITYPLVLFGL